MENLEAIKNLRNRIMVEGYEDDIEYDFKFFKGCECMLHNLRNKMSQVVDVAMHTSFKKWVSKKGTTFVKVNGTQTDKSLLKFYSIDMKTGFIHNTGALVY